jgi:GMP synthase (glutamine-hydrolysing)
MIRRTLGDSWSDTVLVLDATKGEAPRVEEVSALVVTGSPASVTSREPWILENRKSAPRVRGVECADARDLLRTPVAHPGTRWRRRQNPRGREIGTVELDVLEADPLFEGAPRRFRVNMSHVDNAGRLPEGARVVARSERDPHGAVRFGERAWGVQFHPEFDGEIVRGYIDARREQIASEGTDPDALLAEDAPESAELLRRFARIVRASEP